jgi:hypothetical protein
MVSVCALIKILEEIAMAQKNVTSSMANPETGYSFDARALDTQRSGFGIFSYLLFPMIAFSALAYAASLLAH